MKKKMFLILLSLMVIGMMVMLSACGDDGTARKSGDPAKAICTNGVMLGKADGDIVSFKGVPFAKQPVGELRWKAPQAPDASDEEIECYEFGHTALQYPWPSEPASLTEKGEDCLTLNIWEKNEISDQAKPVMVFFHGGAYAWGGTTDPTYDGTNFIKAHPDVILVTCNYRLGLMSWADFSKIEGGEEYTDVNLGLRDNIAALQWIQDNIAQFGGDPENVTIFGESAGGFATTGLAISPKAQGLFKRIIAESGVVDLKDREAAQEFAEVIMDASGAENMDDLMKISSEEWLKLDEENWIADECCGAVADGDILPEWDQIDDAIKTAADNGITLLIGTNQDEMNYFQEDQEGETAAERFDIWYNNDLTPYWEGMYKDGTDESRAAMDAFYKFEEELVPEEYAKDPAVKDALVKSAFKTESWRYQSIDFADRWAKAGGDVYMYLWNVPSTVDEMYKSAVHAVELAYVFNNTEDEATTAYCGDVDIPSAEKTQEAWINYAASGNPSIEGTEWTKYDAESRNTMVIEKDGWKMESDPSQKARELMQKIYPDRPVSYDGLYEYNIWE